MMRIMRHVVFMWALISMMTPTAFSDSENLHEKHLDEQDLNDPAEVTLVPTQSAAPTSAAPTSGAPTQSPTADCTTDASGSYGLTSSTGTITPMTIRYYYEIETAVTEDTFQLSAVVLPKLEYAIANKLLRVILGGTKNCGENRRILLSSQETNSNMSQRRLDLVGLSSNPSDTVLENYPCQISLMDNNSDSPMCTVVQGELTLFLDEATADSVDGTQALDAIAQGMTEDEFVSVPNDIQKVHFIDNFEGYDKVEGPPPIDEPVAGSTNTGGNTTSFGVLPTTLVAAAAGVLLSLFVGFAVYKKRNDESNDDDEEELSHGSSMPSGEGEQVSYIMGMEDESCV